MNYIAIVIKALPVAGVIAAGLYGIAYQATKHKRGRILLIQIIYEFTFVLWCILFISITQVISFGNGLGELINWIPLRPVYVAIQYGSVNAGMLTQILLNIMMCMPLGFLLPLTFGEKFRSFLPVFGVSFMTALLTEACQLISGRNADVDDIIANTLGGLLGFAIYVVGIGIVSAIRSGSCMRSALLKNYRLNFGLSISLLMIVISPLVLIKALEMTNEIGYVYYGHAQPTHIVIPEEIADQGTTADLYRNVQLEPRESLASRLGNASGFDCTFRDVGHATLQCSTEKDKNAIFIYKYNTWTVLYESPGQTESNGRSLSSESDALKIARTALYTFHIPPDSVEYMGLSSSYTDGNFHIVFTGNSDIGSLLTWGTIEVTVGADGTLLEVSDRRTYHQFVRTMETISPRKSIDIAREVGVGDWNGTATISSIEPSYYFNEDTGFLIPTWQVHATFVSHEGQEYTWTPNISAIK